MRRIGSTRFFVTRALLMSLAVMVSIGLVACEAWPGLGGRRAEAGEVVRSKKERVTSPDVAEDDLAELVAGNSAFAFDLYQAIREEDGNLFYSPYSISVALAMTYAGARGETEKQMAETLHFRLAQDGLHRAFNGLELELAKRTQGEAGEDRDGFRLEIANSIWGQKGYSFLPEFLDMLAENYGAGLRLLDFVKEPEESRLVINDWVSEKTEGKIEDLIPEGLIHDLTRLVLANAIYFNAAWAKPFEKRDTRDGTFYPLDGGEVTVPMMTQAEFFKYAEADGYQVVELPYSRGEASMVQDLSMVILLPRSGRFQEFEASLDGEQVEAILKELARKRVALTMPRFEVESSIQLKEALTGMGMPDAFSYDADLSGIDGTLDLYIEDVVHKAFVLVDEAGTEAAAATAVVVAVEAAPEGPVEMTVDRPFIFLIRDIPTNTILFVGRVADPSA